MATLQELEQALTRLEGLGYGKPMRALFMQDPDYVQLNHGSVSRDRRAALTQMCAVLPGRDKECSLWLCTCTQRCSCLQLQPMRSMHCLKVCMLSQTAD